MLSSEPSSPKSTAPGGEDAAGSLDRRAIDDLVNRSKSKATLPIGITCSRVHVESVQKIRAAFRRKAKHPIEFPVPAGVIIPIGGPSGFQDTFPRVTDLLRVSMPGYTESGDIALVYMTIDCGGLCAHGEYVVVRFVRGKWKVIDRKNTWTS